MRLFDLNEAQERAVRSIAGPLLILAGAGTGKTRVITSRVAFLIAQGFDPGCILALTFTNKAAGEMRERLARMVDKEDAKRVTMSTFHALCVRLLRQHIDKLGYKNNFSIYDDSEQTGLLKKIIVRTAAKDEKLDAQIAKAFISKAKNSGRAFAENEETLVAAVFNRYQRQLKSLNAVDFDDLLLLAVQLLKEHPEARAHWQKKYRQIMVDEFQDTNRLQLDLVSLLADGERNVCVVGDDDQSIYGWRGAEASNILDFERHFPNPAIVKLEQNYRSTNVILGAANKLIRNNPRRHPKNLWSAGGEGEKVRAVQMPDDREEAKFVVEEIQRRQTVEGVPWEEFAVLYRMNAQSRLLEENLRRLRIPYRLVGGKSFYDRREIKDFLAYAACLLNPDDDISLLRIIQATPRGIGESTLDRALEFSVRAKSSLFRALNEPAFLDALPSRTAGRIKDFMALLDAYETRAAAPLTVFSTVMTDLMLESGFLDDLKRSCATPEEALNRETNVKQMIESLSRYEQRGNGGLQGFLDEVSLDRSREEKEEPGAGVTLITLHAAKGLEFRHVALVGLEEGILPHDRSKLEGSLDEERRLFYVGITRAMRTLLLTYCRGRVKFGGAAPCHPSSFLKEIAGDFVEMVSYEKLMSAPVPQESVKSRFAQLRAAVAKM